MVVNYSKWDNLELSDDSDIEVHPNVDKRSFIRAKQNQIHQQRDQRKHEIETLKYERTINTGLLSRIDKLISTLENHGSSSRSPEELVFQSLIDGASNTAEDQTPTPPAGPQSQLKDNRPTYSKMMATLIDQVKKEVEDSKTAERHTQYLNSLRQHQSNIHDLQEKVAVRLATLEQEETKKITSESIHTGFDSSHVTKAPVKEKQPAKSAELLNPGANQKHSTDSLESGAEADGEAGLDEDDIEATKLGKEFANLKKGDYREFMQFISQHPQVLAERETDGLLVEAFNSQIAGKDEYARQCVHQALLLQYCRQLGRDGVGLFFKRITTPGHQAQKVFHDDVNTTYARIRTRAAEIKAERAENPSGDVEQIQLHAVEPGTTINIVIPQPNSEEEVEQKARKTFESFPPGLQKALESGSLDEVNKVLGKMSVEEAEEIVGQLGEGGMLSLDEQIIDATTEEGREKLKELEADERSKKVGEVVEPVGDPE